MFSRMYLEITTVCNLSCSFCPGTTREKRFLTRSEFQLLAAKLRPFGQYLYLHVMGEPLLHPNLSAILEIAHSLGFRVILTTNGTLLKRTQGVLLSAPALHKVNISLHAPESNGVTDFEEYLSQIADYAKKASQSSILTSLRLWNLNGKDTVGRHAFNDHVLSLLRSHFSEPWQENSRGYRLQNKIFLEFDETFDWPDLSLPSRGDTVFCYGLREQIAVLSNGTVVPCCLDREGVISLGNLFTEELSTILSSSRAKRIYDGFSCRKAVEPLCRTCGYARRF